MDVLVHGIDVRFHPVTGLPLESGSGALPDYEQALNHLKVVAARDGQEAAQAMFVKLTKTPLKLVGEN